MARAGIRYEIADLLSFHPSLVAACFGHVVLIQPDMQKGLREKPLKDVARFIAPMKPTMVPKLPDDRSKWLLEPKLDGYRAIAVKSAGHANLYSMDTKIYNQEFPAVYVALEKLMAPRRGVGR